MYQVYVIENVFVYKYVLQCEKSALQNATMLVVPDRVFPSTFNYHACTVVIFIFVFDPFTFML